MDEDQKNHSEQQPNIDQLITQANSQAYVFEHGKQKRSLKQWFLDLPRTKKVFLIAGTTTVMFAALMIGLSFGGALNSGSGSNNLSSNDGSSSDLTDKNNDGVVDVNDISVEETNDTSSSDTPDDTSTSDGNTATNSSSVAWWQKLLSIKGTSSSSSSSDSSSGSSSYDYTATNYTAYTSAYIDEGYDSYTSYTDEVSGTPIKVATWNVLKYDNTQSNLRNGVKDIFAEGATVIGLQEIDDPSFNAGSVKKLASNSIGAYSPGEGTGMVWNTGVVEKISANSFRPIASKGKRFSYGKFQMKSTGQQFYVMNVHMQPGVNEVSAGCSSDNCKAYKSHIKAVEAKVKELQSAKKIPLFIVGDFNIDYRNDACKIDWFPCSALGKVNMISSYKALNLKSIIGNAKKYIDQAFFWTDNSVGIIPVSNKIIGSGASCKKSNVRDIDGDVVIHCWNGSDHKPVLFSAKLGGN
jgi:hypothetical protein